MGPKSRAENKGGKLSNGGGKRHNAKAASGEALTEQTVFVPDPTTVAMGAKAVGLTDAGRRWPRGRRTRTVNTSLPLKYSCTEAHRDLFARQRWKSFIVMSLRGGGKAFAGRSARACNMCANRRERLYLHSYHR